LGLKPLEEELARIDAVSTREEIPSLMAHLGRINVTTPIALSVNQDDKDPSKYIAYLYQSGLGLPDRDFYLVNDPKFRQIREQYVMHIEKMLRLAATARRAGCAGHYGAETAIAREHWTRVESRDADKVYNTRSRSSRLSRPPSTGGLTLRSRHHRSRRHRVPAQRLPASPTSWSNTIARLEVLFQVASDQRLFPVLVPALVDEHFAFYSRTLRSSGTASALKRAVQAEESALGEFPQGLCGQAPSPRPRLGETLVRIC
jgi:putative endopeptidase